jgi:hypothetical protein
MTCYTYRTPDKHPPYNRRNTWYSLKSFGTTPKSAQSRFTLSTKTLHHKEPFMPTNIDINWEDLLPEVQEQLDQILPAHIRDFYTQNPITVLTPEDYD